MADTKDKILLVDDEKHLLMSLRDYLVHENYDVITARSGEDALDQLDTIKPDLIVLDISMPGMGGLGFLKRISTAEGTTTYPVLVLTARSTMESFFDTVQVAGFLAKPCDEGRLVRKIREILSGNRKSLGKRSGGKIRVLLAEDERSMVAKISAVFEAAGYEVTDVNNGPEILEKAAIVKPDVMLMKDLLPRLNGNAVAGLIDVMPSLSGIPVVLYGEQGASVDVSSRRYSSAKCVKRHLTTSKPDELLTAVRGVVK